MTIDEARMWLQRHADNTPMPGAREAYKTILEELNKTCQNIGMQHDANDFRCSECGLWLESWRRIEADPDDGELVYTSYEFNRCPECGARVVG